MAGDGREGGFIKLHRRLESWPLWRAMTALQRIVWIQLLLCANWKDDEGWYGTRRYSVRRGQLAHSETTIARRAKVSRRVVRDTIERLMAEGAIGREKSLLEGQAPWLITIVNYERFQGDDDREGPEEGQAGAKLGPGEGQAGALREEVEEGKKGKERQPEDKPPAPAAELFQLGKQHAQKQTTGPAAEGSASRRATAGRSDRTPDPLRRELSDALIAVGREERGGTFAFDGAKDGQGITRLLGYTREVAEHARRFRLALRAPAVEYGYRVDTIAAFATGRIWNHFAAPSSGPTRIRPLAAPGVNS